MFQDKYVGNHKSTYRGMCVYLYIFNYLFMHVYRVFHDIRANCRT